MSTKTAEYLFVAHPVTPVFYHLLKIYKLSNPVWGRPIWAGIESLLECLGEWVDLNLQPFVLRLPGYIYDIYMTYLEAMYSSVPQDIGLSAVKYHLSNYSTYSSELQEFLSLSIFSLFDGQYYLLTSMGAKFSLSTPWQICT